MYDEIFKLKLNIKFMNKGLVPLGLGSGGASIFFDINRVLADLPPQEARAMRRKFRKAWRKIVAKTLDHGGKAGHATARELGFGINVPLKKHKMNRKQRVYIELLRKLERDDNTTHPNVW